jgi:MFS family permease
VEPVANATEGRLVLVIGAVVFVDTMFYAAIAPLLPALAHELRLSKLSAGVMTASYPIGTLVGSLPGGVLVARAGPKFTVCAGLALLACSTLAFGFLDNAVLLDAARFVEGIGGACSWAGGLAWIVADAQAERRGELIGGTIGAAIAGSLFGPVIGTVATAIGRGPAFSGVVILAVLLIVWARRLPSLHAASEQGLHELGRAFGEREIVVGMWLVALPAVASGLINVLGPLRLHRLGASATGIGAAFLAAAALEAVISPAIGRLSDRLGRLVPLRFGLACATGVLVCFTVPESPVLLAVVVVAVSAALAAFWAPAMAMLSEAAAAGGLDQGLAAALMNLAWAGGQIVGAGGGGAVAKAAGDVLPVMVAAGFCALTLAALTRGGPAFAWVSARARRQSERR